MPMGLLDQYESRFARADKERYVHSRVSIQRVLFLTDQPADVTRRLAERARRLLRVIDERAEQPAEWVLVCGDDYSSGAAVLERVDHEKPDLVVTYRALKEQQRDLVYSLGTYLDVLTQALEVPILVLPVEQDLPDALVEEGTPEVMALTDHLTGQARLVDWGVRFVLGEGGELFLSHVEDDHTFARYLQVIGKVPSVDTEDAREEIRAQLLREPTDYIQSCADELARQGYPIKVHAIVKLGHRVQQYKELIAQHEVDLLVFVSQDEHQVAMHGVAYSLAVELKHLPLLLL